MKDIITPLGDLVFVIPMIRNWGGAKTVDSSKVQANAPSGLFSGFEIHLIDTKALAPLESVRGAARRALAKPGIKIDAGVYALPASEEGAMQREMADLKDRHTRAVQALVQQLPTLYQEQEDRYPGFEPVLRGAQLTAAEVVSRCSFDYTQFRVQPTNSQEGFRRFEALAQGTVPALVDSINQAARKLLTESFNVASVTQKAVNPVRRMLEKMRGFAMFDPRIIPSMDALERVLAGVPKVGPLAPSETMIVASVLRTLADPDNLLQTTPTITVAGPVNAQLPLDVTASEEDDTELEQTAIAAHAPSIPTPAPVVVAPTPIVAPAPVPSIASPAMSEMALI